MFVPFLFLLALQDSTYPLKIENGGFCTGLGWMTIAPSDKLTADKGPDFRVYRYDGSQTNWWGIYYGRHAQVGSGKRTRFLKRGLVSVSRVSVDGKFRGYLAVNRAGIQNHFFGSPFRGDDRDRAFFEKIDFGTVGQEKCERHPAQ